MVKRFEITRSRTIPSNLAALARSRRVPTPTSFDLPDRDEAAAEEVCEPLPAERAGPYQFSILRRENGAANTPTRSTAGRPAALGEHVSVIIHRCAEPQMLGVNAGAVVTCVANHHLARISVVSERPRYPMGQEIERSTSAGISEEKPTISPCVPAACQLQAAALDIQDSPSGETGAHPVAAVRYDCCKDRGGGLHR